MHKVRPNEENVGKTSSGISIYWLLTKEIGAKNFELRYIEIPVSGKTSYGTHPHEHEVYVLKGKGIVKGKDYQEELLPGDSVFIAEDEEHQWINQGDCALCFICVVPAGAEAQYKPNVAQK